ncbi:MAG TPA: bifunctional glutamate N-acetyltransferase/amino-acid acetyltransferase ArgJ [Tepidisphaeraceae bacterium]|nr:bifunctional glutamate N-acetyltransferase/amino-acid acetyltransferase ArgJ [Tepidisphaeraceae bacterium]
MAELHLLSPLGFRASGVYSGIKTKQIPDVGLLICDTLATSAAVFTSNQTVAAPVIIGRKHIVKGKLRGVVANSGNANACTGKQGERDALRMCQLAAKIAGASLDQILPSSTGIIGHPLPMDKLERGIIEAGQYLGDSLEHATLFADAIMTTDTKRKTAAVQFKVGKQTATLAGVCKGSGMIGPRLAVPHATMLAYLTTDVQIAAPVLRKLMQAAADASFNAVTVDDQTSTNDTACLMASGASDIRINTPAAIKSFTAALNEVCQSLAYQIAADGEGATKVVTIEVKSAKNDVEAKRIARSIANSPLVKCAMNGNDPNWGRIICAAGQAEAKFDPTKALLTLQGTPVFRRGGPVTFDAAAVSKALQAPEVKVVLTCGLGKGSTTCWTCDLSKGYVTINADYHT